MKKLFLSLIAIIGLQQISHAQQPMTISPGLVVGSPTAGSSGLRFSNLNSGTTVSTTPTKVLSLDATGNVILGNAASGGGTSTPLAINLPVYANSAARTTAIPTPTTGMLVLNTGEGGPEFFAGTWNQLNLWQNNPSLNRVIAPNGAQVGRLFIPASSVTAPAISLTGNNTVIRYTFSATESNQYAITQETATGVSQPSATVLWKYYDNSPTPIATTLFGYTAGVFTVNGFTKLGNEASSTTSGVNSSVPSIKNKLLSGSTNPNAILTTIAHGIPTGMSKIVGLSVIVQGNQGTTTTALQFGSGYFSGLQNTTGTTAVNNGYTYYFDDTNIYLERSIAATSRPYKILITYTP